MAFLRFTRDKRGYEHFYLVQPITNRRGKVRTRILYWFRTPPNVRVGREPFDDALRRALEAQNPDVSFDWQKIIETPIPSADTDKWRERRRVERLERAARQAEAEDEVPSAIEPPEIGQLECSTTPEPPEELEGAPLEGPPQLEGTPPLESMPPPRGTPPEDADNTERVDVPPALPGDQQLQQRRRRRKRRRRGQSGSTPEPHDPKASQ